MPILRIHPRSKAPLEIILGPQPPQGRAFPLTLGAAPAAANHLHLPDSGLPDQAARLQRSTASKAPVLILSGCDPSVEIRVQDRPIAGIRALRHGDRVQLGPAEMLYLDAAPVPVSADSPWKNVKCSDVDCGDPFEVGKDQIIFDPWSDQPYHDFCWKKLEVSPDESRFPVRRFLLAGLRGQVQVDHFKGAQDWPCALGSCKQPHLRADSEMIDCPKCKVHFHPGCWLALLECSNCSEPIADRINRLVFLR